MCGIAGIYDTHGKNPVREGDLTRMRDSISYRGPDSAGHYISPDCRVGLGHRRLAIIDLTPGGHQPMRYEDTKNKIQDTNNGKIWITFNGEIYNFRELRNELQKKGYTLAEEKVEEDNSIHIKVKRYG